MLQPGKVLVTSLYDEDNPVRMSEYMTCLKQNLNVFSVILILYEETTGVVREAVEQAESELGHDSHVVVEPVTNRPSFEYIFNRVDALYPGRIACIANADIFFDETLGSVNERTLLDSFFVVSRREVVPGTLESRGLIMDGCGFPNTFSADAWLYKAPLQRRFKCDFGIGTFHCDSLLNHYIVQSGYKIFNPCLDVKIHHVHHPDLNSSTQKAIEAKSEIEDLLKKEKEANVGAVPLVGVQWSHIEDCVGAECGSQTLRPTAGNVEMSLNSDGSNLMNSLLASVLILDSLERLNNTVTIWLMIELPMADRALYWAAREFQRRFNRDGLALGFKNDISSFRDGSDEHAQRYDLSRAEIIRIGTCAAGRVENMDCTDDSRIGDRKNLDPAFKHLNSARFRATGEYAERTELLKCFHAVQFGVLATVFDQLSEHPIFTDWREMSFCSVFGNSR